MSKVKWILRDSHPRSRIDYAFKLSNLVPGVSIYIRLYWIYRESNPMCWNLRLWIGNLTPFQKHFLTMRYTPNNYIIRMKIKFINE